MTIRQALSFAHQQLTPVSDAPALDAQRVLVAILGVSDASWLFAHSENVLSALLQQQFQELVSRRAAGEPLAYILGEQEFYGRSFMVNPAVLIPRPSTEHLIDAACQALEHLFARNSQPRSVADIGTGSGCIAITLALEAGSFLERIYATDISAEALAVARQNAKRHQVDDRVVFFQGDMLQPLRGHQIDLIVSNPPYLPAVALPDRQAGLAKAGCARDTIGLSFEPRLALDGGIDGQYYINQIKSSGIPAIWEGKNGEIFISPYSFF